MFGYIISDKKKINIEEHEIQSFDILHKTNLNIFVVENNKVLYKNDIIFNASKFNHVEILEWFKNSGYKFKYIENAITCAVYNYHVEVLEWFKNSGYKFKYDCDAINWASIKNMVKILEWFKNRNVKKVIKWSCHKFIETIKYKTKNNYIKGYNKN